MAAFDPTHIKIAPGTLYVAPLGTTEPTAITGAWPAGWVSLGYTEAGSQLSVQANTATVDVEEEYYSIKNTITGYVATLAFALAEATARNYSLAINAGGYGTGFTPATNATGTNPDGSIWVEPPDPGNEVRVMVGWDALIRGTLTGDAFGRFIGRQALSNGQIQEVHRKGSNKIAYAITYQLEKPPGLPAFRRIFPAVLAS